MYSALDEPKKSLFKKKYTFLTVRCSLKNTHLVLGEEITKQVEQFNKDHASHSTPLKVQSQHHFEEGYVVTNGEKSLSSIMGRRLYWIFTFLGISLIYRLFLVINIGHIEYKIEKKMLASEKKTPLNEKVNISENGLSFGDSYV